MSEAKIIGITNDGVRLFADDVDGAVKVWGYSVAEGRVEIDAFTIVRGIDHDLPLGEYPADLVSYRRAREA